MRTIRRAGLALAAGLLVAGAAWGEGYRLEKRLDLAAGGTFSLRAESASLEVRGGDGSQAVVTITSRNEDFERQFNVRFEGNGTDRVEVSIERKFRGPTSWFGIGSFGARVTVELPRSASAELHSAGGAIDASDLDGRLRAESSGGAVHVERVKGDVVLSSSGGGVEAVDLGGGARLDSSGGSVKATNVAGKIEAGSSGGGVRIEEAHGEVIADSSGGPVRVSFAAGNAKGGDLGSSGGGGHVWLDPSVGLEIDAHSSGGGIDCEVPVSIHGRISRGTLKGQLNGGGAVLRLRSSGGGIDISER